MQISQVSQVNLWHNTIMRNWCKVHLRHLVDLTIILVKLKNIEEATPWKMRKNVKKEFNFSILYYKAADLSIRGFTRLRLSEFVQISEFFQFYITDIVRHLSHFPKVSI